MDRRTFIGSVVSGLLDLPLAAQAQQAARIYRLGLLEPGPRGSSATGFPGWLATPMGELGYAEGRNLVVEARFGDNKTDQLPGLARELAMRQPDVIVASSPSAIRASMNATATVPIVFLSNVDPVAAGFVASLARPGGNVTGMLVAPGGALGGKKLEFLKGLLPNAARIAMLVPDDPGVGHELQVQEVREAAASLGMELIVVEARGGDYARAFATIVAARAVALLVGAHSRFVRDGNKIIELAASHRLPAIYEWPTQVNAGGLMSYGASATETYRRVAIYVDRIFKGAKPSELPVEQPGKLLLVINLKTATAMGLSIPQSLLLRADEVIR